MTTIRNENECRDFIAAVRRVRRQREFAGVTCKTEAYRNLIEDLDRDAGKFGGGDKELAVSAVIAAFCDAENI